MEPELPKGFVVTAREDGGIAVTYKLFPAILKDILVAAAAAGAGGLLFRSAFQLLLFCFALAGFMLVFLWMSVRKLEFDPGDGTFSYRSGPTGGKVAASDITTLDAVQLGRNDRSFALIATDREGEDHNLFRYLDETEAKALLDWTARNIEDLVSEQNRDQDAARPDGAEHRADGMNILCPKCGKPITVVHRVQHGYGTGHPLLYCSRCRAYFVADAEGDAVGPENELVIPQPPVKLRIDDRSELFSTRVFHASGILLGLIALFWMNTLPHRFSVPLSGNHHIPAHLRG